jgi:hypothetical protein
MLQAALSCQAAALEDDDPAETGPQQLLQQVGPPPSSSSSMAPPAPVVPPCPAVEGGGTIKEELPAETLSLPSSSSSRTLPAPWTRAHLPVWSDEEEEHEEPKLEEGEADVTGFVEGAEDEVDGDDVSSDGAASSDRSTLRGHSPCSEAEGAAPISKKRGRPGSKAHRAKTRREAAAAAAVVANSGQQPSSSSSSTAAAARQVSVRADASESRSPTRRRRAPKLTFVELIPNETRARSERSQGGRRRSRSRSPELLREAVTPLASRISRWAAHLLRHSPFPLQSGAMDEGGVGGCGLGLAAGPPHQGLLLPGDRRRPHSQLQPGTGGVPFRDGTPRPAGPPLRPHSARGLAAWRSSWIPMRFTECGVLAVVLAVYITSSKMAFWRRCWRLTKESLAADGVLAAVLAVYITSSSGNPPKHACRAVVLQLCSCIFHRRLGHVASLGQRQMLSSIALLVSIVCRRWGPWAGFCFS